MGLAQRFVARRDRVFRFGFFPVAAFITSLVIARCCLWTAATAALVHQPAT
jgi:hypothetical protein